MCLAILGPSVLTLPFAVSAAGLPMGCGLLFVAVAMNIYTVHQLIDCADRAPLGLPLTMTDLTRALFGARVNALLQLFIFIFLFGCVSGNLIAVGALAHVVLVDSLGVSTLSPNALMATTVAIVLPLCCVRRLTCLGRFSSPVGLLGLLGLSATVMYLSIQSLLAPPSSSSSMPTDNSSGSSSSSSSSSSTEGGGGRGTPSVLWPSDGGAGVLATFPIASFSFSVQPWMFSILFPEDRMRETDEETDEDTEWEVKDEDEDRGDQEGDTGEGGREREAREAAVDGDVKNGGDAVETVSGGDLDCGGGSTPNDHGRGPRRLGQAECDRAKAVTHAAMGICFFIYTSVGVFGAAQFPGVEVKSNILLQYARRDQAAIVMSGVMAAIVIICIPVNIFPLRELLDELLVLACTAMCARGGRGNGGRGGSDSNGGTSGNGDSSGNGGGGGGGGDCGDGGDGDDDRDGVGNDAASSRRCCGCGGLGTGRRSLGGSGERPPYYAIPWWRWILETVALLAGGAFVGAVVEDIGKVSNTTVQYEQ